MVRRINELRQQFPKNMDEWFWQLWFEGYPVDIVEWCRERIVAHEKIIGRVDKKRAAEAATAATRKPIKRLDPRRSFYSRLRAKVQLWYAFAAWAIRVGIGALRSGSIFDPGSLALAALAALVVPGADHASVRERLVGSGIEDMNISRLLAALDEADASALETVRKDCWALSRAAESRSLAGFFLSKAWRRMDARAFILAGLILLRRSPDHQEDLAAALEIPEPAQ